MKSTTGLLLSLMVGCSAFAQPVIVSTMSPFPVGTIDSVLSAPATLSPGAGGAGITWNFSTLSVSYMGQVAIVDATTSPYGSTFPTSNFCAKIMPLSGSPMYVYERISSARWEQLANNYAGTGTGTVYTNPETTLQFPMHYLDAFTDTFQKTTGGPNTVDVTYDGYGTLITPVATYTNVVRIKKYWGPGDYAYNWLTTSPYLGIIAVYDATGNSFSFFGSSATTAVQSVNRPAEVAIVPNPFSTQATLVFNSPEGINNAWLTVYDATGRVVRHLPVTQPATTIDRESLSSGLYFYTLHNNAGRVANGKFVIQ